MNPLFVRPAAFASLWPCVAPFHDIEEGKR